MPTRFTPSFAWREGCWVQSLIETPWFIKIPDNSSLHLVEKQGTVPHRTAMCSCKGGLNCFFGEEERKRRVFFALMRSFSSDVWDGWDDRGGCRNVWGRRGASPHEGGKVVATRMASVGVIRRHNDSSHDTPPTCLLGRDHLATVPAVESRRQRLIPTHASHPNHAGYTGHFLGSST